MDLTLIYKALDKDEIQAAILYSTDGRLAQYGLTIIPDDKHLLPPYYAAPVVRSAVLKKHPEIKQALKPLLGTLNETTMAKLNAKVDIQGKQPKAVARAYLRSVS